MPETILSNKIQAQDSKVTNVHFRNLQHNATCSIKSVCFGLMVERLLYVQKKPVSGMFFKADTG